MKRVFTTEKGAFSEDLADSDILDFLQDYLLDNNAPYDGSPYSVFKESFKVTIIIQKIEQKPKNVNKSQKT